MEKKVIELGFALCYFFFLCMLVIGSQFVWGVIAGMVLILIGSYFLEL